MTFDVPLLNVRGLTVATPEGVALVEDVTFHVHRGGSLGIVGESGSGKSVTALSIGGLVPELTVSGQRVFQGQDLSALSAKALRAKRGGALAYVFQDAGTSMLPMRTIGAQIMEQIRLHQKVTRHMARRQLLTLLRMVGLPDPQEMQHRYIHQLSGGMRQRAMIAMAISCQPDLLIADEPSSALDVTVQAQILAALRHLQKSGMALILVTHDIGVVADNCDHIAVFYSGMILESGPTDIVLSRPRHPYTSALLATVPTLDGKRGERPPPLPVIRGSLPHPSERPAGCVFAPRCPLEGPECHVRPALRDIDGRQVRCIKA
ncbi:ABC transporter ATP-binding protein [Candidatus Kirkpatrickella diaphorinae]|uniref:ABC transporter ATP-binding protein n=1 Tax=Candidatus Kirkpatrickella diaphorinae TaxID=2984322 RepID=A0ABY6GIU4_9PROT|nr:ABC transporter ATP-binding protein [Candidatus Kirkpatrickella diaphorinae]UYH51442.1 ABC transporter ATP-binding protein [Candidatus Kirkpatrickella diaphorinae]